jgi:hypothetical protein
MLEISNLPERQYRAFVSRIHRARVDMARQFERTAAERAAERTQALKEMRKAISGTGRLGVDCWLAARLSAWLAWLGRRPRPPAAWRAGRDPRPAAASCCCCRRCPPRTPP